MAASMADERNASEQSDADSEEEFEASDQQLQEAFEEGFLKPGLNFIAKPTKEFAYDLPGMKNALQNFKQDLSWIERMDVTCGPANIPGEDEEESQAPEEDEVEDYFKRELKFYRQAQAAVLEALPQLNKLNVQTKRPADYFAEMAKSDAHMKRVREKLIERQIALEKSEKAKKLRELKKFGKSVQQEVLSARQREKSEMTKKLKKMTKGKMKETTEELKEQQKKGKKRNLEPKGRDFNKGRKLTKKQQYKDAKYGFGGQKRNMKRNTRDSARADDDGFSYGRNRKDVDKERKKRGQKVFRPGKNRRKAMKQRKGKKR
ncbi:putative rRNA-processing protein EBP2 [Holothuria leucospilota]|uniref:rRNA-processing protein EBP2 n=1 Tax=Holothuria leucospilota TaxID=206669 RepID=A0A9Q1HCF6_HOLLE|nr:putative rRNA-processing protein EBP2 [Holothuria leucospilota]